MGVDGVSSDESGDDEPEPSRDKTFTRVPLEWRPQEFAELQYQADESAATQRQPKIGKRRNMGSRPRRRLHPSSAASFNPHAEAPKGLPRNCYRSKWLAHLSDAAIYRLEVSPLTYDYQGGFATSTLNEEA